MVNWLVLILSSRRRAIVLPVNERGARVCANRRQKLVFFDASRNNV